MNYLEEYINIVFISLFKSLMKLFILDFELNQINTIIELIETIYIPQDFYYKRNQSHKNNTLLFIEGRHLDFFRYNPLHLLQ